MQIRSHAQKFILKCEKEGMGHLIPPPRPKRKALHPYPHKTPTKKAAGRFHFWVHCHHVCVFGSRVIMCLWGQTLEFSNLKIFFFCSEPWCIKKSTWFYRICLQRLTHYYYLCCSENWWEGGGGDSRRIWIHGDPLWSSRIHLWPECQLQFSECQPQSPQWVWQQWHPAPWCLARYNWTMYKTSFFQNWMETHL